MDEGRDRLLRSAAFAHLDRVVTAHGDVLPWAVLREGFPFENQVVPLISQQGIFKPAAMELPLSITYGLHRKKQMPFFRRLKREI